MLPAAVRTSGQNLAAPDVCNTPIGTGTSPIPYVNMADHSQATGFSNIVQICGGNALHLSASIPSTTGDEAGTAHSSFKQKASFSMGNPVVSIENQPAITLTSMSTGNNMNASSGAVIVTGVATVLFTRRLEPRGPAPAEDPYRQALTTEAAEELAGEMLGAKGEIEARRLDEDVGYLRIRSIALTTPARFHRALVDMGSCRALLVDLRGNPGGDLRSTVRLAEELLPAGAVVARLSTDRGGERLLSCRHGGELERPVVVLIDGGTASAAELLAAALRHHGRALLVGEPTYGKGRVQRLQATDYASVATCLAPDGASLEGSGLTPDVAAAPERALGEGLVRARAAASGREPSPADRAAPAPER